MSYQVYRKVLESSAVTHCCTGRFVSPQARNVAVVKHDVLELYTAPAEGAQHGLLLECVYPLGSPVVDCEAVRFPQYRNDALVLAFADAKLAVLVWSAQEDRFVTKSLHLLEEPEVMAERSPDDEVHPHITIRHDTRGTASPFPCLVALVFRRFLFVLPFVKPEDARGDDVHDDTDAHLPLGKAQPIDLQELSIRNVRDVCFVGGYHNPTLMFLHEQQQTWAGRVKFVVGDDGKVVDERYLTSCLTILSLSMQAAKVIYTPMSIASKLPYNAFSLEPLTAAPYGALVVASNTIIHMFEHEQSGFGVHVNKFGKDELSSDSALLMPYGEAFLRGPNGQPEELHSHPDDTSSPKIRLVMNLNGAHVTSLPNHPNVYFLALSTGEVCLLHLAKAGNAGAVRGMSIERAPGLYPLSCLPAPISPLPSCPIASCLAAFDDFLFIGSRIGDSLVLKVAEADAPVHFTKAATFLNTGPIQDISFGDSSVAQAVEEDDDMEIFPAPSLGMSMVVPVTLKPSTDLSFAERHATMELVAAVGRDHDGAVCVLNRTVKPMELCALMAECTGCWTLNFKKKQKRSRDEMEAGFEVEAEGDETEAAEAEKGYNKYLVLAMKGGATKVLRCGEELREVTEEGDLPLDVAQQTVGCVSMAEGRIVVQVTTDGAIATDDRKAQAAKSIYDCDPTLDKRVKVHEVVFAGDWGLMLLTNGSVQLLTAGFGEGGALKVDLIAPPTHSSDMHESGAAHRLGYITSMCLYNTTRGDAFFFAGDNKAAVTGAGGPTTLACLAWTSGTVQIIDMQDWRLMHEFHSTLETPDMLSPWTPFSQSWREGAEHYGVPTEEHIVGLWVGRVEKTDQRPHLIMLTSDEEVHCYKAFLFGGELRFRKTQGISSTTRRAEQGGTAAAPPRLHPVDDSMRLSIQVADGSEAQKVVTSVFMQSPQNPRIASFQNVFGLEGFFMRTPRGGVWGFSEKGFLRMHEMVNMKGGVTCIAPLHTASVKQGFALITPDRLRLMTLTWHRRMNFRAPWPTRKILLRSSPHKVLYDPRMRTYTLVVSTETPFKPLKTEFDRETDPFAAGEGGGGELESKMKVVSATSGIPIPTAPRFELLLYSAYSWKPFTSLALQENETCLAFADIAVQRPKDVASAHAGNISKKNPLSDTVHFQAIGTGFPIAEDIPCRGRLVVYRVRVGRARDDRVLEPDCEVITKGPVTAVASTKGHIFAAVAAKVHVFRYDWTKKELVMVAWCDARLYTTSLTVMKDFLLAGDVYNSMQLMRWSQHTQSLNLLGKDANAIPCAACETLVDRGSLTFAASDDNGNISSFSFKPPVNALVGEFVPVADFHTGTTTQKFLSLRTLQMMKGKDEIAPADRTALLSGTKEGAIQILQPVAEHLHRDLSWLFAKMVTELDHMAGLHPRAVRKYRGRRVRKPDPKSRRAAVVDMTVITRYLTLPHSVQEQLAAAAGIGTKEQIVATIRSVQQETRYL
eukprot:TRINITY_DN19645_c0_g2_i1.p1 TRINITY_DN19645_c0_g2~~TRINITY_DN19645_c0_g2_i1.p1  ORF type:complete len:1474 (+),score=540.34 TRINITY_DN19645_c0_g2_i1:140-4561(+)